MSLCVIFFTRVGATLMLIITIYIGSHAVSSVLKIQNVLLTLFEQTNLTVGASSVNVCMSPIIPVKVTLSKFSQFFT